MLLPLHIFEPRYRSLAADVGEGGRFGVVLIERGSEVGVGSSDVRASLGVVAQVKRLESLDDGRFTMLCVGTDRFRVERWHPDDPYPVADIEWWPDNNGFECTSSLLDPMFEMFDLCRSIFARHGINTGPPPVFDDDPGISTFQVAALSPLGELDRYDVLQKRTASERAVLLAEQLEAAAETLEFRLSS